MVHRRKQPEHSVLHTVEQATELLRRCGVGAWAWWFAGSAPFAVALLHFVSDMSQAASAADRLPGSALVLALVYWWMKITQAVFSDRLLRQLRGDNEPAPLPFRGKLRFVTSMAVIHCTTPWVLPMSLLAMLPFGWAYAAYHNVSILALATFRNGGRTRDLINAALAQSKYRQGQNHVLMLMLVTISCVVWLNWHSGAFLGAYLSHSITGAENPVSRHPMMMLSSGILATTIMLSYVVVGPFVKALYTIRCFYSLSRRNGEDIEVAFRATSLPVVGLAVIICLALPQSSRAALAPSANHTTPVAVGSRLDSGKLGQSIQEVMKKDVFQWRMPRREAAKEDAPKSWLRSFFDDLGDWVTKTIKSMNDTIDGWMKSWFKDWFHPSRDDDLEAARGGATPWANTVGLILKGLLAVLGVLLALLLLRQWRNMPPPAKVAEAVAPEVNLESNNVVATQLPENEWLRLAEEKINAGEFRLAMRALFLATLAHLGERKLLAIIRSKSNGDYVRELSRRARDSEDLRNRFSDSVKTFDWAWYGWHDVTRELLEQFRDNHQHIISDGHPR